MFARALTTVVFPVPGVPVIIILIPDFKWKKIVKTRGLKDSKLPFQQRRTNKEKPIIIPITIPMMSPIMRFLSIFFTLIEVWSTNYSFKRAFDYFCLPTGLEKPISSSEYLMPPSSSILHNSRTRSLIPSFATAFSITSTEC